MIEPATQSPTDSDVTGAAADALPRHTTPTWESELLISGATVFGLLQLPSVIAAFSDRLHVQLASVWQPAVLMGDLYGSAVIYGLIITFLLHLATRAYWVALVGLRSVFPGGIRWDRFRSGTISRQALRDHYSDQDANIERADNFSTLVFACGIALVVMAVVGVLLALPALILAPVLQTRVWPLHDSMTWFLILLAIVLGPIIVFRVADSILGTRLRPDGRPAQLFKSMYRRIAVVGPQRVIAPLLFPLTTNIARKHGLLVILAIFYLLMGGVSLLHIYQGDPTAIARLPIARQITQLRQDPNYYADIAADGKAIPHIQSDVISDPYLRLWVPLDPHRQHAFDHACSRARPTAAEADFGKRFVQEAALAACLGNLFSVQLDGALLPGLRWHFMRDDAIGIDGLRAYISMSPLSSGEHELSIAQPTADQAEKDDVAPPWRIPFMR
ncbi:MAG: hypothetical protein ABIQ97_05250 [Lysobacteraceae bacterium]